MDRKAAPDNGDPTETSPCHLPLCELPTPRASDAHGPGRHGHGGPDLRTTLAELTTGNLGTLDETTWGIYAAAIARWELLTGRPVPAPTQPGRYRKTVLAPPFVEWLMGLPAHWVTDPSFGLPRTAALRVLGNGVVPAQAATALRLLLCRYRDPCHTAGGSSRAGQLGCPRRATSRSLGLPLATATHRRSSDAVDPEPISTSATPRRLGRVEKERGNQRAPGEQSRKEGGKVFGGGSRATVAITVLVKNPSKAGTATIHYTEVGDYLTREEKLAKVAAAGGVAGPESVVHIVRVTRASLGRHLYCRRLEGRPAMPPRVVSIDLNALIDPGSHARS
ncbi:hypothetical protein Q2K19_22025 [Micromonospora soli]|uniref:hypothetical protein n=1 Tax=Micromonospora sp. NBRC 110009 TaxID=3061627 RepID=UPI002673DBB0|nr:hypothetical protein [Micromonospora sp. NBRC 110009]WKU02404.1 hypothetical protein Q2K19_22025 [Micromonospora sp. NBRC 110009]